MRWVVLALALLAGAAGRSVLEDLDSLLEGLLEHDATGAAVEEAVRTRVSAYVALVQRTLGLEREQRPKREVLALPQDPHGVVLLTGLRDRFNIPAKFPGDMVLFSRWEQWFAAALETDSPHPEQALANSLVLYRLVDGRFLEVQRVPVAGGLALAVHEMGGWTYLVAAERLSLARDPPAQGSQLFRLQPDGVLLRVQVLQPPAPSDLSFWELAGRHYLGVAVERSDGDSRAADSLVYEWLGEHLDIVHRLPSSGAAAIAACSIQEQHFIAVANHVNDAGETDLDSTIFRLSQEQGRYVVHQRLRTHGAMDVEFFSMQHPGQDTEHFLAVANKFYHGLDGFSYETNSVVYKWTEGFFVPFQSFRLPSASQWCAYSGARGELVLFAAGSYGLHAFQYDGWRFQEVALRGTGNFVGAGAGIARLRSYSFGSEALLVVASKHNSGTAASALALQLERRAPLLEKYSRTERWCSEALRAARDGREHAMLERVRAAPKLDSEQVAVRGALFLTGGSRISRLHTETVRTPSVVQDKHYQEQVAAAHGRLQEEQRVLGGVRAVLDRSLRRTGVNTVPGRVVMSRASVQCPGACSFATASVGKLNGESVEQLVRTVIRLDEDLVVPAPGELRFAKVEMADLNISRVLGQHAPLLSRVGAGALAGSLAVRGLETSAALRVGGLLDGVRMQRDSVLLLSENQSFSEPGQAMEWHVDRVEVRGRVSGMRLDVRLPGLPPEVLRPQPGAALPQHLSVGSLVLGGKLGSVTLADVTARALRTRDPQLVTGAHVFSSLATRAVEAALVSGLDVAKDLVRTDLSETLPGHLSLNQSLRAGAVQVYRRLGPIAVAADGTMDLLLARGVGGRPQEVTGSKRLRELQVAGQARVHGRLLGVTLPEGDEPQLEVIQDDIEIVGNLEVSGAVRVAGGLRAEDLLDSSGRSLAGALSKGLRLDSGVLPAISIEELEVSHLRADLLNGVPTESWIVDSPGAKVHLRERTQFVGNVRVSGSSELAGHVNNVDLVRLNKQAFKKFGDQDISGFKSFRGINVNRAGSRDTIVGSVRWSDLWERFTRDVMEVNRNVVLTGPLSTNHLAVQGRVNKLDLKSVLDDTVYGDGSHFVFDGSKTFLQEIHVRDLVINETASGPGVAVLGVLDRSEQDEFTHYGNLDLESPLSVKHLNYRGRLDGVLDSDWSAPWLEVNGDQTLRGKQTFMRGLQARGGVNVGSLNGVNVSLWASQLIRLDDPSVRLGRVVFESPVFAGGPVRAGLVAGVNLSDAVVSLPPTQSQEPQVISAPVVLSAGLQVGRSLSLLQGGLLAGENFQHLCAFANPSPGGGAQHLRVEGDLLLDEELVLQDVNGMSLARMLNHTWMRDRTSYIKADMAFKDLNLTGEVVVQGLLDGVALNDLSENVVSLSGDQPIIAPVRVTKGIVVEADVISKGPVDVAGKVAGVSLRDFEARVLLDGPDQEISAELRWGELHAAGNVSHSGTVNGLDLRDLVRTDREVNLVTERKAVRGQVWMVELDVEAGARVQGVDLAAWYRDAIRLQADQRLSGAKTLRAPRLSSDMSVAGLVGGVRVDRSHLLLRHGDQVVRVAKTLEPGAGAVRVQALELDGLLNSVRTRELLSQQAYRTGDVVVESPVSWTAPLHATSAILEGRFHGVNVSQLVQAALHPPALQEHAAEYAALGGAAARAQLSLRAQGYYLSYFRQAAWLRGAMAVLPLGRGEDPAAAIAVVSRPYPAAPLVVDFFRWDSASSALVPQGLDSVSLPPSVMRVRAARWADQNAIYWEMEELGLFRGYVMALLRGGELGLAALVHETHASPWVQVDEACVLRGSASGGCKLSCPPHPEKELPAEGAVHAVMLRLPAQGALLAMVAGARGVDVWRVSGTGALRSYQPVQTLGVINATALAAIHYRGLHYLAAASGAGMVHVSRLDAGRQMWAHWVSVEVRGFVRAEGLQWAILPSNELALYVASDCPELGVQVFLYRGVAGLQLVAELPLPGKLPLSLSLSTLAAVTTARHDHLLLAEAQGPQGEAEGVAVILAQFKGSWENSDIGNRLP